MKFAILCLKSQDVDLPLAKLKEWLQSRKVEGVFLQPDCVGLNDPGGTRSGAVDCVFPEDTSALVVLGGDGSLLAAARLAGPRGIPILGVNLGHLGFLTEVEVPSMTQALDMVLTGSYSVEKRMMLEAEVISGGRAVCRYTGLNDAVVNKIGFSRLITLDIYVGSQFVQTVPADGVIVSSPTGSTAYSLSAGGPIVSPLFSCLVVTPICPHTLHARSHVLPGDEEVRLILRSCPGQAMLTVDGQLGHPLQGGDSVVVRKSTDSALFIRLGFRDFYQILREKLRERPRHELDGEER